MSNHRRVIGYLNFDTGMILFAYLFGCANDKKIYLWFDYILTLYSVKWWSVLTFFALFRQFSGIKMINSIVTSSLISILNICTARGKCSWYLFYIFCGLDMIPTSSYLSPRPALTLVNDTVIGWVHGTGACQAYAQAQARSWQVLSHCCRRLYPAYSHIFFRSGCLIWIKKTLISPNHASINRQTEYNGTNLTKTNFGTRHQRGRWKRFNLTDPTRTRHKETKNIQIK